RGPTWRRSSPRWRSSCTSSSPRAASPARGPRASAPDPHHHRLRVGDDAPRASRAERAERDEIAPGAKAAAVDAQFPPHPQHALGALAKGHAPDGPERPHGAPVHAALADDALDEDADRRAPREPRADEDLALRRRAGAL